MPWYALAQLFSTFLELMRVVQLWSDEKDGEILILRQQLDVMVRQNAQVIRPGRLESWSLAVLTAALKKRGRLTASQLGNAIRIVKPDTVIKWHRQHVRRKWTQTPVHRGGRSPVAHALVDLIVIDSFRFHDMMPPNGRSWAGRRHRPATLTQGLGSRPNLAPQGLMMAWLAPAIG